MTTETRTPITKKEQTDWLALVKFDAKTVFDMIEAMQKGTLDVNERNIRAATDKCWRTSSELRDLWERSKPVTEGEDND